MSKVGLPAAGTVQEVRATPIERVAPLTFSPSALSAARGSCPLPPPAPTIFSTTSVPATPRRPMRVGRVLHRHVVVGDARAHWQPAAISARHVEIHEVALVVLDDEQHAGAGIHRLGGRQHLVGGGRGEDLAGTGGIEHADDRQAAMQRLVAGTAAGDQRDLARLQVPAADEFVARRPAPECRNGRQRSRRGFR